MRTYGDKFSTNFPGLNVIEDGVKRGSFTVISIDSLLALLTCLLTLSIFRQLCL